MDKIERPPLYLNETQRSALSIRTFFRFLADLITEEDDLSKSELKIDDPRVLKEKERFEKELQKIRGKKDEANTC